MKLTNKQYDIIKWLVAVVIPALITFLGIVFNTIDVAYATEFLTISTAFNTMLGTIFKISDIQYKKGDK
ncbi:MAG: phage holin [Aerococcus suis]|nr:phage holin [Aerococcus suis]